MATIERALSLEHAPPWSQVLGRPDWIHGLLVGWSGALASAREVFSVLYREALDRGDEHSLPFILFPLARFEFLMGDWTAALAACARMPGREHAQRAGRRAARSRFAIEAIVEAHLGHVEPARAKIAEGLQLAERRRRRSRPRSSCSRPAASSSSRSATPRRPSARLTASPSGRARPASSSRPSSASTAIAIEAKIALGHRDEAQRLVLRPRAARQQARAGLAAGGRRALPRDAVLGARRAGRGASPPSTRRSRCTSASASRSSARARCSCSAPFSAASARSAPRANRSRRRSRRSTSLGRGALGGAHARRARARRRTGDRDAG